MSETPTRAAMTTLLGTIDTAVRESLERDMDDIAARARAAAVEDVRLVLNRHDRRITEHELVVARDAADATHDTRIGGGWIEDFLAALGFKVGTQVEEAWYEPLSDDALIAEAASRGMSVMDAQEAARRSRIAAGIEALADEWEAEAGQADALVDTARRDTERSGAAAHARQLFRVASALRALLSVEDEKAADRG